MTVLTPPQIALEACYDEWHREHPTEPADRCRFCRPMVKAIVSYGDARARVECELHEAMERLREKDLKSTKENG